MHHLAHASPPLSAAAVRAPLPGWGKPLRNGAIAAVLLLALYFSALTLVSGWDFTVTEFGRFWFFVVPLAAGFGVQVALYSRLHALVGATQKAGAMVTASGATSTAAMVSCCAHYLVNLAPVLGATGLVALAAQFQVEFFWVGLGFSALGIAFVHHRLRQAQKEHEQCHT
jgi:P-type Cu+ transporter